MVGFRDGRALVMPLGPLDGITLGARADFEDSPASIYSSRGWLGRVVNGFGEAMDGKRPLPQGTQPYPIKAPPPDAMRRGRVGRKLDLGIRALNAFATCCAGQRMGIFAGSGVGKSTLMSMLARNSDADVIVIGLIGERGREVKEFIEDDLGPEGLARSVVVAATSDEAPLVRRQAAYVAMTVAEQLRDCGLNVLLMMDSVTRFAMAQLQAALQVTAGLHQLSLLNFQPCGPIGSQNDRHRPQARSTYRCRDERRRGFLRHRRASQAPGL